VIIPVIAFSYVQHGLGNFVGWGLVMKNKSYHISANIIAAAAVNIGLNFVLIPRWGILGAAFATLASYIVWNTLKMYFSARFYDLRFEVGRLLHVTAVGVGIYGLSLLTVQGESLILDAAIKLLLLASFPFVIVWSGFFHEREKVFIKKTLRTLRQEGIRATVRKARASLGE
jgi:O-antigen/teichoic acid export membrane protein